MDRTKTLAMLTIVCLIGTGISEIADLDDTIVICFFGFLAFGVSTIVAAFYKDEEEEEDDTEDN